MLRLFRRLEGKFSAETADALITLLESYGKHAKYAAAVSTWQSELREMILIAIKHATGSQVRPGIVAIESLSRSQHHFKISTQTERQAFIEISRTLRVYKRLCRTIGTRACDKSEPVPQMQKQHTHTHTHSLTHTYTLTQPL